MKAYLAGPDVFRPDALAWAAEARALCAAFGVEALVPLDSVLTRADEIYRHNLALIAQADVVLANLDSFRGAEPDSGTCFEAGYAVALGKRVIGYTTEPADSHSRLRAWQGQAPELVEGVLRDRDGWLVENFGHPANLMLAESAAAIVAGGLEAALRRLTAG
ncbi:nucleoside 2-deoxyribosyltransferase [Uliginosibacterium paludis]|uniref:Nucleoside 2-deoxyribosyltransferase n=1 Tax=Uliginosibacterium paludis TaxID=1615952 RepID=A0ABV2CN93_9RHOO